MIGMRTGLVLLMAMSVTLQACYYDKEELLYPGKVVDCSAVSAKFTEVKSIIAAKCATAGCHNAGAAAGGAVLETYNQITALSGRIIQRAVVEKTMPPTAPLSANEIATLQCWVNSGRPNN